MKILLIHSGSPARQSVDLWRIIRPFKELQKHVDWQIDHQPDLIPRELYDKDAQVPTDKLIEELEKFKDYDIVWTSYYPDATLFDCMMFVQMKYGTKFVLDVDDDIFHIPSHFPVWKTTGNKGIQDLKYMVQEAPYLVTSTPYLQKEFAKKRSEPTYLFKNYIGDDFKHKPFNNGKNVVIGYFGSITHKKDLHDSGFIEALQLILNKYPQAQVLAVGQDIGNFLPKNRYTFHQGKPGLAWLDEIWPNINCDISVAPLIDDKFNKAKSNIKYLESALIPAAFIGSNVEPYRGVKGLLVDNSSEGWYEALESLILSKKQRYDLIKSAKEDVNTNWHINKGYKQLKSIIESLNMV